MSSLKMTFSLASLVLLMAFIAMPVMAHKVNATHDALDAHPVVESLIVDQMYLTATNTITATVKFAPAADVYVDADADATPPITAVHATNESGYLGFLVT